MKLFVLLGLGDLGQRLVEEFNDLNCQIVIIDTDRKLVEEFEDQASEAYILDKITQNTLKKTIPLDVDAVIIDFSHSLEISSLATHYTKLLGIDNIYIKADSDDHAKIFKRLGAKRVIFPDKDAAQNLTPLLVSPLLTTYNFMNGGMVTAEMIVPSDLIGKSVIEADLRRKRGINVVAIKRKNHVDYEFATGEYHFEKDDTLMVFGYDNDVEIFSQAQQGTFKRKRAKKKTASRFLGKLFNLK